MTLQSTFIFLILWCITFLSLGQTQNNNYIGASCWEGYPKRMNSLGVSVGRNYTYASKPKEFALGHAFSIHYERKKKVSRIRWQAAIEYNLLALSLGKSECYFEPWLCGEIPNKTIDKFDIIAFTPTIKYTTFPIGRYSMLGIVGGYSVGRIIRSQSHHYFDSRITKSPLKLNGLKKTIHQFVLGIDFDYMVKTSWVVSLQSRLNVTNIYDIKYGDLFVPSLSLSLGKQF